MPPSGSRPILGSGLAEQIVRPRSPFARNPGRLRLLRLFSAGLTVDNYSAVDNREVWRFISSS
jgi:hypothetical protein